LKRTLTADSTGDSAADEVDAALPGTTWTITLGTKVRVVITQGATAFETGDEFLFCVFKSTAVNGKQNDANIELIDAGDGP